MGLKRMISLVCSFEFVRMSVLWTLSLLFSHVRLLFRRNSTAFPRRPLSAATTTTKPLCIVTGATSGLGAATAEALSREGFFVILVGRSALLLAKTMSEIRKRNKKAEVEAFEVDLSSFSSIINFRTSLMRWLLDMKLHPSIQLLINNAGILATSHRTTPDGFDEMMMTNYLGPFCLTKLLLPLLLNSPVPSRIVNVSSFTHRNVYDVQVGEELFYGKSFSNIMQYPFAHIYGCSKLFLLFFSYELHRQTCKDKGSQLSINVADPGVVKTNIMREMPLCLSQLAFSILRLLGVLHIPEIGMSSILDAALAPPEASGIYFFGGKGRAIKSSSLSYNTMLAKKLWETSYESFLELKRIYEKTISA